MMIVRAILPSRGPGPSTRRALAQRKYARTGSSLMTVIKKNFQTLAVNRFHALLNIRLMRNSRCVNVWTGGSVIKRPRPVCGVSISDGTVDRVLGRVTTLNAVDLLQHADRQCLRHCLRGIVRSDRQPGVTPQRAFDRKRLGRKHVERRAREGTFLERGQDVGIDLQRAAPGIDQVGALQRAVLSELA